MSTSPDVRSAQFAAYVERVIARARARGMNQADVLRTTGIGRATLHSWLRGQRTEGPKPHVVRAFCDRLGEDYAEAAAILWPEGGQTRRVTPPAPMDPDVATLLRILADPNTKPADRDYIRRALRMLAAAAEIGPPVKRSARKDAA